MRVRRHFSNNSDRHDNKLIDSDSIFVGQMNQWQGSAGRRFWDVKQKFRLYLRRCGPSCQMNCLSVTVSIGELRFGWALHRGCFVLVGESVLMFRSCALSVSCLRARFSVRVGSLRRCFDDGDLLVCQARRRRLFSRTSRSICKFVLKWLVCTALPCGVEIVAASTNTSSGASVEQSMSASMLRWGVNLMCELTYFLCFNQLLLCDVSLRGWSVVLCL